MKIEPVLIWYGKNIQCTAKTTEGWLLAECTLIDNIVNGSSDGTTKGKKYLNILTEALFTDAKLPNIMYE